ncbi:MAG: hypothetical protein ACXWW6_00395 [Candidatus Limnocylindrales bacterium]
MNAEFQWWLLILGIVIGGALVYLVLADLQGDRDEDVAEADELPLDERAEDARDETGWSVRADPVRDDPASVGDDPASVGDHATMQRDSAEGEASVADLP